MKNFCHTCQVVFDRPSVDAKTEHDEHLIFHSQDGKSSSYPRVTDNEAIYLALTGKVEIRSRRSFGNNAILGFYFFDKGSPSGVVLINALEDNPENRDLLRRRGVRLHGSQVPGY